MLLWWRIGLDKNVCFIFDQEDIHLFIKIFKICHYLSISIAMIHLKICNAHNDLFHNHENWEWNNIACSFLRSIVKESKRGKFQKIRCSKKCEMNEVLANTFSAFVVWTFTLWLAENRPSSLYFNELLHYSFDQF